MLTGVFATNCRRWQSWCSSRNERINTQTSAGLGWRSRSVNGKRLEVQAHGTNFWRTFIDGVGQGCSCRVDRRIAWVLNVGTILRNGRTRARYHKETTHSEPKNSHFENECESEFECKCMIITQQHSFQMLILLYFGIRCSYNMSRFLNWKSKCILRSWMWQLRREKTLQKESIWCTTNSKNGMIVVLHLLSLSCFWSSSCFLTSALAFTRDKEMTTKVIL